MSIPSPLSIGEVINLLRDEFPDLTVSKVRFLEVKGLISPPRSGSGYREFDVQQIDRLRYILRQQRDHFLPLKVIKSKLTAWERGEEPTVDQPEGPPADAYFASGDVTMSADELARAAGISRATVDALVAHGVLDPDDGVFTDDHLAMARAAGRLMARGLEARHLRAFRLGANRESDLLAQLTSPLLRHKSPANTRRAAQILADCAQAARDLQDAIVRRELRSLLED
ncbi:MAG TPA: MerR family transcriptional regulator [Acidimicrobiia bacterium]|nr:MerR family transcriptional regulator [Acidimicrobiia bacterium]